MEEESTFITWKDDELISHSDVIDMLRMTMLVYNYGKDFTIKEGQNIEGFLSSLENNDNDDNDDNDDNHDNDDNDELSNLDDERKKALYEIAKNSPKGEVIKFITESSTDLQCAITISHTKKRINIIFRGSESLQDWYYDLNIFKRKLDDKFQPTDYNNVHVHSGFFKQLTQNGSYDTILDTIKLTLVEFHDYKLFISGHSLGGALCTLFGYLLSFEIPNDIIVVSFASPRIGNSDWKNAFNQKSNLTHFRVTNHRDVVTAAPMFNYKHVGHCIRVFDDCTKFYPNYSYNGWWEFSLFNCWRVSDHMCDLYYQRLLKNSW